MDGNVGFKHFFSLSLKTFYLQKQTDDINEITKRATLASKCNANDFQVPKSLTHPILSVWEENNKMLQVQKVNVNKTSTLCCTATHILLY